MKYIKDSKIAESILIGFVKTNSYRQNENLINCVIRYVNFLIILIRTSRSGLCSAIQNARKKNKPFPTQIHKVVFFFFLSTFFVAPKQAFKIFKTSRKIFRQNFTTYGAKLVEKSKKQGGGIVYYYSIQARHNQQNVLGKKY